MNRYRPRPFPPLTTIILAGLAGVVPLWFAIHGAVWLVAFIGRIMVRFFAL